MSEIRRFRIEQLDAIAPQRCPCGVTRRAFAESGSVASVHQVDIHEDARVHFHKIMTEIYIVLEGEGSLELDGELVPVKPMSVVTISPGCRHRAVGSLKILNIAIPAFDPTDEHFDEER